MNAEAATLYCVGLARTRLTISKDCTMKAG